MISDKTSFCNIQCLAPWITPNLKQRMHEREIAKLNATRSNDSVDWLHYKQLCSSVNNAIAQAKKSHNTKAFRDNKGNSRMIWRVANVVGVFLMVLNCCTSFVICNLFVKVIS